MAKFELNVYGQNDEILNTFSTDHIRWGLLLAALDLQEQIKDAALDEQMQAMTAFMLELFPGMTETDIKHADAQDVINVFMQVSRIANKIKGKNG